MNTPTDPKLARCYGDDGRLLRYPSKLPLRRQALTRIAASFAPGRTYTEREVNALIAGCIAFGDHELIRRELCQHRFLGRLRDGSQYWLEDPQPPTEVTP